MKTIARMLEGVLVALCAAFSPPAAAVQSRHLRTSAQTQGG